MDKLAEISFDIHDYLANDEIEKIAVQLEALSSQAKSFDPYSVDLSANKSYALILDSSWGMMPKFAHATPELTEINMAILASTMDKLPEEVVKLAAHNLTRAAQDFNLDIPQALEPYKGSSFISNKLNLHQIDELNYAYKMANYEEEVYALPTKKLYKISTAHQCELAQDWFDKNASLMDSVTALEFSKNLYKQANSLGLEVKSKSVKKLASLQPSFGEMLADQISIRQGYLTPDQEEIYQAYADYREKVAEAASLDQAVEELEAIDRKAGLNRIWDRGILHPLESVLAYEKKAEISFEEVDLAALTQIVDSTTARELQGPEGAAVFNSLPQPVQKELQALI